jgi:hypothetical protein
MRFHTNHHIEKYAASRLAEFEQLIKAPLTPPISIERFVESVLGLNFLWDRIEELPGETILGALKPKDQLIILNETHVALFEEKPGLLRMTIGHEGGHWDMFFDKTTLEHPPLLATDDDDPFALRSSRVGEVEAMKLLISSAEGQDLFREIRHRSDEPDEARVVNRYAAAILMPQQLLHEYALTIDRTKWPALYQLAETFAVTISALTVRLQQLDLLYVKGKRLFASQAQALGQTTFPF